MTSDNSSEASDYIRWLALDDSLTHAQKDRQRAAFQRFIVGITKRMDVLSLVLLLAVPTSLLADTIFSASSVAFWVVVATPLLFLVITARTAFDVLPEMATAMFEMDRSHQHAAQIVQGNLCSSTPFILYLRGFSAERLFRVPWWRRALALPLLALRFRPQFIRETTDLPGLAIGKVAAASAFSSLGTISVLMLRNISHPHVWTESVPALRKV
ncbi:MAG TPA: hypothetical protein DEH78_01925 [Solibacterales bacterium]|nr:hypothetical protein [Bryobacterales bacterium]